MPTFLLMPLSEMQVTQETPSGVKGVNGNKDVPGHVRVYIDSL